jgi:hypothetical protein
MWQNEDGDPLEDAGDSPEQTSSVNKPPQPQTLSLRDVIKNKCAPDKEVC